MEKQKNTCTEQGRSVPKLRFPEFKEKWNCQSLIDIAEKIQDGTHFSPKTSEKGDYLYITSKNVKDGFIDLSNVEYISKSEHDNIYKRCDIRYGDVLVTKDGTIGQTCVNEINEPYSLLSSVAFIRPDKNTNNYFLYNLISSPYGQREISRAIAGQALKRITLTKLNGFSYYFPTLPEQQKIAAFLTSVDERIAQLTKKKTLLEQYKKGVMQKIFSQEIRFKDDNGKEFGEWKEFKLGELGQTYNGLTGKNKDDFGTGFPFVTYKQIFDNSIIDSSRFEYVSIKNGENQNKVLYGDVFFTTSSETPNEVGFSSILLENIDNLYLNSFCFGYRIKSFKILSPLFASFLFRNRIFRIEVEKLAQGSTRYNMSKTELMKLTVSLPCFEEQTKIANFLSAIDKKIEGVAEVLEATQRWKKGLLQQMFC